MTGLGSAAGRRSGQESGLGWEIGLDERCLLGERWFDLSPREGGKGYKLEVVGEWCPF